MCSFANLAHHRGDVQAAVHDKYRAGNKVRAGEARKRASPATSAGSPNRPSGVRLRIGPAMSGVCHSIWLKRVLITPGQWR